MGLGFWKLNSHVILFAVSFLPRDHEHSAIYLLEVAGKGKGRCSGKKDKLEIAQQYYCTHTNTHTQ